LVKLDFFSLVDTKKCEVFCEAEIFGKAPGSGMNRTWGFHLQCFTLPGTTVDGRNPKQPLGMYKTQKIMGYLPYQLVSRISEP